MYEVTIFGIHLTIRPIAFTIPLGGGRGWNVYWYGILIAIGFLLAIIYGVRNAKRYEINLDRMLDVVLVATPVAILCARLFYILFDGEKLTGIGDFFGFGSSSGFAGLAIYGGVIGAFASGYLMCRLREVNVLDMFDLAATGFLIGQSVGRWGNFVNQEAFGSLTGSSFWGMESERTIAVAGEGMVHPCFLYESLWCLAGFFLLHFCSKHRKFKGEISLLYCIWYGFGRAVIESLRTDSLMIGPFRVSQLLSALLCLAGLTLLILGLRRVKAQEPVAYDAMFDVGAEEEVADGFTRTSEQARAELAAEEAQEEAQEEAPTEPEEAVQAAPTEETEGEEPNDGEAN